jgi:hypothetical protein
MSTNQWQDFGLDGVSREPPDFALAAELQVCGTSNAPILSTYSIESPILIFGIIHCANLPDWI